MEIFYSPYSLRPKQTLNAVSDETERKGVLLKVIWEKGLVGYADLHPWPELGDDVLEKQLSDLRINRISPLVKQSLWLARKDAELRSKEINAFDLYNEVKNNFLLHDFKLLQPGFLANLKNLGFTTIKIKMGRDLAEELTALDQIVAAGFKVRLDFNAVGTPESFKKFIDKLSPSTVLAIEYVEDPFPFDSSAWLEAKSSVKIAIDNQYEKVDWQNLKIAPFDVIVIKPAKVDVMTAIDYCQRWNLKATVTSYMDHAVGISHAITIAMGLKEKYGDLILDSGCLTQASYHTDPFFAELESQGPYLQKVRGTGVGFNSLLEALPWLPL